MSKKKIFAFFVAAVVVVCLMLHVYQKLFHNYITGPIELDDIPHQSCTDMSLGLNVKRSHKKTHSDILIGIRLTGRKGYTKFTASVTKNYHNIVEEDVAVVTTGELGYNAMTLRNWYGRNSKIIEPQSDATAMEKVMEEFLRTEYKILFLIDSEMVFLPAWKDFITERMINPTRHKAIPFLSLYHSATLHNYTSDCDEFINDLCKGKIVGKYGFATTKDFARAALSNHQELLRNHDWNKLLQKQGYRGLFPTKSLIMRIGQTDQDENFCGTNDVPYGFKLCELPCWIRNGIEFYFDLCTNPQEIYSAEFSLKNSILEDRLWTRPALVYSFYGNKARYVKGALENARRLFTIYPGYKIWAYVDNSVATDVVQALCSFSVKFLNMTGSQMKNQMSWRFLIAAEPVRWFTILDIDYRMIKRGKEATDDWLKSGKIFHVMRDHPNHSKYPINGQMWGGYGNSIPNVKELIVRYNAPNTYMNDIHFLTNTIWPIIKNSVWVHDAYSIHKYGEDHPFPTERKGGEFIGNVDFSGD